jgi:hypothetical protein
MSFNISNVLPFQTVCAEGSSAHHFCVQLEGFCIDSGHPIGAGSGVSLLSRRELTVAILLISNQLDASNIQNLFCH